MSRPHDGPRPIRPEWPAPERVRAASTTRTGGVSEGAWRSLNLSSRVADDPEAVRENRARLRRCLDLPEEPRWLRQNHGTEVAEAGRRSGLRAADADAEAEADVIVAREPGLVCAVLSADCLPVLLCDAEATVVAAAHAGWRGVTAGVLEAAVRAMAVPPASLMAWLGPAIGAARYEVGRDVRNAALAGDPEAGAAFRPAAPGKWLASLEVLARRRLERAGVGSVHGGGTCTADDPARFFSHRRDGAATGRMATLVWMV